MSVDAMNNRHSRNYGKVLIVVTTGIGLVWLLFGMFQAARRASEREKNRQGQYVNKLTDEWIEGEIKRLTSGQTSQVYFYSTANADSLVKQLSGMPEIKRLTFEMTDLTDTGVTFIATLPNLEKLTIHGGTASDVGLNELSHIETLKTLHLINLDLTDNGLTALRSLSNLRYLTIYSKTHSKNKLTDVAVQQLRELKQLEKLNVGGGWLSTSGVDELKIALPGCSVVENYADDEW